MICQRCLQRLGQPRSFSRHAISSSSTSARNFSRATSRAAQAVSAQTATATNPQPNDLAAATSTSAAQPFSAPLVSGARQSDLGPAEQQPPKVVSSCPAGTPLKGLNFKKNAQDPLALEDEAYPAWLWRVLDKKAGADDVVGGEGDMFSKSKKQRRIAAKALRKQQLLNPGLLEPKIPLYEQTIDLPVGDGSLQGSKDAIAARTELTKAMRDKRRSKIKEDNFLKEMR